MGHTQSDVSTALTDAYSDTIVVVSSSNPGLSRTDSSFTNLLWLVVESPP